MYAAALLKFKMRVLVHTYYQRSASQASLSYPDGLALKLSLLVLYYKTYFTKCLMLKFTVSERVKQVLQAALEGEKL